MSSPAHPTAGEVIATLQRFIRGYFEASASVDVTVSAGVAFEEVATTLARCNPACWCAADQLAARDVADQIAASIALALREIDHDTPNYAALDRVRVHMHGMC